MKAAEPWKSASKTMPEGRRVWKDSEGKAAR